jgi:hypothetical protein
MNHKFDELTKGLAQSTTRRQALKRFGVGLAGMALACFGLANRAEAHKANSCGPPNWCDQTVNPCCCTKQAKTGLPECNPLYFTCAIDCAGRGGWR